MTGPRRERCGTDEAYARLHGGQQLALEGRTAEAAVQRDRALGFYRAVGASKYVGEAEALVAKAA